MPCGRPATRLHGALQHIAVAETCCACRLGQVVSIEWPAIGHEHVQFIPLRFGWKRVWSFVGFLPSLRRTPAILSDKGSYIRAGWLPLAFGS